MPNQVKRGRGRPPVDPADKQSAVLFAKVTPRDRERVQAAARHRGEGISAMLRTLALREADRIERAGRDRG